MTIMQGADNLWWLAGEAAIFLLSIIAVWYLVITGRGRNPTKQKRGESAIETYGDGIEEDHAPLSKFLIGTYIFVGIWAILYILWTGVHGL